MTAVNKLIEEYLDAVEVAHGREARKNTRVRWTGGTQVVLQHAANDERRLVEVGRLRSMTNHLRRAA